MPQAGAAFPEGICVLPGDWPAGRSSRASAADFGDGGACTRYWDTGVYQQMEGPAEAEKMLEELHYPAQMIERVSYLVGHHHTYQDIRGLDYQILVEADFLVNMFEGHMDAEQIRGVREKIFRTRTGKKLLDQMFLHRVDG